MNLSMKEKEPYIYTSYSRYLKEKYGATAYRISVDAGFTCPNREKGGSGCSYCAPHGSRAVYLGSREEAQQGCRKDFPTEIEGRKADIKVQIERGMRFLERRYKAKVFLLYFQAFSNTYGPVRELGELYDYALTCGPFRELIISTRPDCIDKSRIELLSSYITADREVWVELGLQSFHNRTLKRINRGHEVNSFLEAFQLLRNGGIRVTIHLIFGLPGESESDMMETVKKVARLEPDGVKIHNLHIPQGTSLFDEYMYGELSLPCSERHVACLVKALEYLPPRTVIQRMTSDSPKGIPGVPVRFIPKNILIERLEQDLERRKSGQGSRFRGMIDRS